MVAHPRRIGEGGGGGASIGWLFGVLYELKTPWNITQKKPHLEITLKMPNPRTTNTNPDLNPIRNQN